MAQSTTSRDERGIEHAASSPEWLRRTLGEIVWQIRRTLDADSCVFRMLDWDEGEIRLAAAWFAGDAIRDAMAPVLARPYEPQRPGVTEAAVEQGAPLLIRNVETWPGAGALRRRLHQGLEPYDAARTWSWYQASSFIACPVRTAAGRTLGVLTISTARAEHPFGEDDLRIVAAFADLAALALERSELLDREERRTQVELLLNEAAHEVTRSLDVDVVYGAIVDQAAALTGATKVMLARVEPATHDMRVVARRGMSERLAHARFLVGEGMIGRVASTGEPYLSRRADAELWLSWVIETEHIESFIHVPISLGPRLFGVLNVNHQTTGYFGEDHLTLLLAFSRAAAAAIANALDFQRERRIADALTQGFIAGSAPELGGIQLGLVYAPAGHELGGGDVFGAWTLPGGAVALLVGDVAGKGIEVAALSAMVRFFVEARAWDADRPRDVLDQVHQLLSHRLPAASFVSAFFGVVHSSQLRYCNAGHSPVLLVRADGSVEALAATGVPLGVTDDVRYMERSVAFGSDDLLLAATDGLAEARRGGEQFGDAQLGALLARHGRTLRPQELVELLHRELEAWTPRIDDDVLILAARPS